MTESKKNRLDKVGKGALDLRGGRMLYVDNIRIFLIVLVVLHHLAIGYGGTGGWVLYEKATDGISPILLTLFNAVNQSFFMSFFFLVSGYFVPRSFDKKGAASFVKDRLIRLGIPVLVYAALIWQMVVYVLDNFARGKKVSFYDTMAHRFTHPAFITGPLWFVEALLLFTLVYVVCRLVAGRFLPGFSFKPFDGGFPSKKAVFLSIAAIAVGTFVVRIGYPIGVEIYHFQVGHYVHYVFCYWLGILAYRGKWFEGLTESQGRFWTKIALASVIVLPIILGGTMALEIELEALMGRLSWYSAVVCIWESFSCLSIIVALLHLFRTRFDHQNRLLKGMSPNAYTVFIVHQLVVVSLMALFLGVDLPSIVKFLVVASTGVPLCFLVSHFIVRNIPFAKRVLG
ncbi:MAG: acyltransferase [Proteobacteria bacterium]|nr:acyltransferase [Pseudomonadota bacterium]